MRNFIFKYRVYAIDKSSAPSTLHKCIFVLVISCILKFHKTINLPLHRASFFNTSRVFYDLKELKLKYFDIYIYTYILERISTWIFPIQSKIVILCPPNQLEENWTSSRLGSITITFRPKNHPSITFATSCWEEDVGYTSFVKSVT